MLHDAAHAPNMHDLLSVSKLLDAGAFVNLARTDSHIILPTGEKIPVRRSKGLFLVDYLVPLASSTDVLPTTIPAADVSAFGTVVTAVTGSETVPDATVVYPTLLPSVAPTTLSTAQLNHHRWGHIQDLADTKLCTHDFQRMQIPQAPK